VLRYAADWRTLFFVAVYFGILVGLWVALPAFDSAGLEVMPWAWAIPAFVALCVTSFQGAVSTHNAVHCPIFKSRPMNKLWQVVLTLTYGHPVSSYVPGHNLSHHKHTQSPRDVMRTHKVRFGHNGLNLIFFMASIVPSIMRADAAYAKAMRTRHPKWFRQLMLETVVFWGLSIGLFVLDWRKALILWLIPHLYAQWGIVTMNLLQHDGCDETSDFNHSRNFVGKVVNWFTFNNGFHTIHHMIPGLHWSLTPAAHAEKVAPHIHPNLDQKSLLAYCFQAFILGRRRDYLGNPYTPPPARKDEEWIPHPRDTPQDLGAEGLPSDELNELVAHRTV